MKRFLCCFIIFFGLISGRVYGQIVTCDTTISTGDNLLQNSDFEDDYSNFSFDANYNIFGGGPFSTPNDVLVGTNGNQLNSVFVGTGNGGSGNFYMIDGSCTVPNTFYQQMVQAETNTWYFFRVAVQTLFANGSGTDLAFFTFKLGGLNFGTNFQAPGTAGVWVEYVDSVFYLSLIHI